MDHAVAMMTYSRALFRPMLLFCRKGYDPGTAAHEALHALSMTLGGMYDTKRHFDSPLTTETNELWAACMYELVMDIQAAVGAYDALVDGDGFII